ncbi:MAG: hypothetical protein PHS19_06815 [Eubacteriales bacterium]|nr:hypothetical protein [Eubacteriales bacterium]
MDKSVTAVEALEEIRNNVLMIVIAGEYFCDETGIKKTGTVIEKHFLELKEGITALKKQFPGKFHSEVDSDSILEKLNLTIKGMLNPNEDILERCSRGELGRELEGRLKEAQKAVKDITAQVFGYTSDQNKTVSVSGITETVGNVGGFLGKFILLSLKLLLGTVLIICLICAFLYFTMEKEGNLSRKMAEAQNLLDEQNEKISDIEKKKEDLRREIAFLDKQKAQRDNNLALLRHEVEIQKLNQDQDKIEAIAEIHISAIENHRKRIEEIRKKSLIKRLLRQ